MEELWAATPYENYEVSNFGKVRAVKWGLGGYPIAEPREHKNNPTKKGYLRVMLCIGGQQKNVSLALLVAEAFIGARPSPQHIVSYRDGDKTNCNSTNLFWATRLEAAHAKKQRDYAKYGKESSLGKELARQAYHQAKYTRALEVERLVNVEHLSMKEAGKRTGLSESGVYRILKGSNNRVLEKAKSQ